MAKSLSTPNYLVSSTLNWSIKYQPNKSLTVYF